MQLLVFHGREYKTADVANLPTLLQTHEGALWLDMSGDDPDALRIMRDVFKFHPLSIEDTRNHRQRPKLEEYHTHWFAILNSVVMDDEDVDFHEIDVFIGKTFMVTVHESNNRVIDAVRK
jgi:magnesium transporter